MNNDLLKKAVKMALLASITSAMTFSTVYAQDASDDGEIEEVVVTGSRLNTNPNLDSPNPVQTISAEEVDIRGTVRVEDLVNVLPQVFAGQAGEVSNGASGTSTLNLRGLGAVRTLTLIDGRRLPYGSSSSSAANLDLIPSQLVESIDILTGGASAVYGSDAIGGVANFKLKKNFEGFEADFQTGWQQSDNNNGRYNPALEAFGQPVPGSTTDGENYLASFTFGANSADDKGNVTFFASYENQEEVVQADRTFSACTLDSGDNNGFGCFGSANFRLFGGPGGFVFQQDDGELTGFTGASNERFNFGATNFFQRPNERFTLFSSARYELNDNLEAFGKLSYVNNFSDAQIAPSASFGFSQYQINCDNPLIQGNPGVAFTDIFGCDAAAIAAGDTVGGLTASHRNVEGGERNSRLDNSALRLETGLRGSFAEHWDYEVFGLASRTEDSSVATNDFVISQLQQAFFATTDADGNVVCVDQSGGCVPYNIFQRNADGSTRVTQDALDFIQGVGVVLGETEQTMFGGQLQADLGNYGIQSPYADSGVGFLVGFEKRNDALRSIPDEISQQPDGGFTGVGGPTLAVEGEVDVTEFFFESQIPLVTGKQFVEELTLNAQYRFSDYEANGNGTTNNFDTDTYGVSLNWTPTESVRLRTQFQRAVRAPNVIGLYTGQGTGLPNLTQAGVNANGIALFDPCASDAPIASLEACARTGVTAAQFGNIFDVISGQTQSLTGGNPDLRPESSDTVTIGAVLTPEALPGFTLSVDYFDISVEDAITGGIGAQTALDECLETGDDRFCDLITRNPLNGSLAAGGVGVGFQQTNLNIAELATDGIDVQATYGFDSELLGLNGWGSFKVDYAATFLESFDFVSFPGDDVTECRGQYAGQCGSPNPKYRHRMLVTWDTPWDLSTTMTYRHSGTVDNPDGVDIDKQLTSVSYIDLSGRYSVNDNWTVRGGILNLADRTPPVSVSSGPPLGNGNTYPTVFDTGRTIFLGLNYSTE